MTEIKQHDANNIFYAANPRLNLSILNLWVKQNYSKNVKMFQEKKTIIVRNVSENKIYEVIGKVSILLSSY